MIPMLALGLVMLSLLLAVVLRRTGLSPNPVPGGTPTFTELQQLSKAAHARRAAAQALQAIQRPQPVHSILLAAIEAETNPGRRTKALERLVESVSDADLPAMLDSLARDVSSGAAELRPLLVRRWAESDAPAAAAWTSLLPESPVYLAALEQVAIAWANTDLSAASDWVHAMPEGGSKQAATLDLAYEAARTEPISALELGSALPQTRERDDLLVHAVSQWAGTDSTVAATWAMKVSDPALRQRLVASVAIVLAEQDAAAAVNLAVNSLVAGEDQDRAAVSIVQRWAQNSPQAAASWVSQFPDIPSRGPAVQNLLALWTAQDAAAAGTWLLELPAGPLRDVGIAAYDKALAEGWIPPVVVPAGGI